MAQWFLQSKRKSKSNSIHNARKHTAYYTTPDYCTWDFLAIYLICVYVYWRSQQLPMTIAILYKTFQSIRLIASSIRMEIEVKLNSWRLSLSSWTTSPLSLQKILSPSSTIFWASPHMIIWTHTHQTNWINQRFWYNSNISVDKSCCLLSLFTLLFNVM